MFVNDFPFRKCRQGICRVAKGKKKKTFLKKFGLGKSKRIFKVPRIRCGVCGGGGRVMVFNATFNNISVIFVEDTRIPGEIHLASP